ncbi:hypothetical protein ACM66B_004589 [Microbotryomycetes sp. NB124-2]
MGWFSSRKASEGQDDAQQQVERERSPAPATPAPRTFEQLVQEEIPVQRASVAMQGGPPTCMTLFDEFFSCFSLGNQARALYRYGHALDCSPKFEDFKFCMSIKSLTDEQKERVWVQRRAEMWAHRRLGPSSEDVWTARTGVYEHVQGENDAAAAATETTDEGQR